VKQLLIIAVMWCMAAIPVAAQGSLSISTTNVLNAFALTTDPTPQQALNILTSWQSLTGPPVTASVCVYMSNPMAGSAGNSATISASSVRVNGVSIVTGTTNCGVPGVTLVWSGRAHGTNSQTNSISINIGSYPASLPADTYTGTINLVATAQ
jgi:hypothetical protein